MNEIRLKMSDLQQLIAQGEGQQLEFKRSLAELETAARSVVAFANADGGIVLVGVRDAGEILGVEVGEHTKERLATAIMDSTDPIVYPTIEIIPVAFIQPVFTRPCKSRPAVFFETSNNCR